MKVFAQFSEEGLNLKKILAKREFVTLLIILGAAILITIINPAFLRLDNLLILLKGNVVLGIMALGMLPVIVSGGIDLSVSSIAALSSVLSGLLLTQTGANMFVVVVVALGCGLLVGCINGLIICFLRIPPIIATLATMKVLISSILYVTKGENISGMPSWFSSFGIFDFPFLPGHGLSVQIVIFIVMALITWLLLRYTTIGRSIYAIGGSEESSIRVGYNVSLSKICIYGFCGMTAGLGGFINTSIIQQVNPNSFTGFEMNVISAVIIGGASIMGGIGSVSGTTLGVILLAVLNNGLIIARVSSYYQDVVLGAVILLAVSIDVIEQRRAAAKRTRVDVA